MEREPYWDYMSRRIKEIKVMSPSDLYEREVFELQKALQQALIRQKELIEQEYVLKRKISLLGGDERQFEMEL